MRKLLIGVLLLTGCSANSGWVDNALKVLDPEAYEREKKDEQTKIKLVQCRKDLELIPVAAGSLAKLGELIDRGCRGLYVYNSPDFERDLNDFKRDLSDKGGKVVTLEKEAARREVDLRRTRLFDLPSVFRLPIGGFHATSFSCC